jgi:hypothetical protein
MPGWDFKTREEVDWAPVEARTPLKDVWRGKDAITGFFWYKAVAVLGVELERAFEIDSRVAVLEAAVEVDVVVVVVVVAVVVGFLALVRCNGFTILVRGADVDKFAKEAETIEVVVVVVVGILEAEQAVTEF